MTSEQAALLLHHLATVYRGAPPEHELAQMRRILSNERYGPAAKAVYAWAAAMPTWPTPEQLRGAIHQPPPPPPVRSTQPRVVPGVPAISRKEHAAWARRIRSAIRSGTSSSPAAAPSMVAACADEISPPDT